MTAMLNSKETAKSEYRNQCNLESTNIDQLQNLVLTTNSPSSKQTQIDNAILAQSNPPVDCPPDENGLIPHQIDGGQNQSPSVSPILYVTNSNLLTSGYNKEVQNDLLKLKKIQVRCQPRSKFRPRTQNESKNSSHYIRCEENDEFDYPAIHIPQVWSTQSDMNIIEVELVDIQKQSHPYILDNKSSKDYFDNETLVFKQDKPNVIYFRLVNDDFISGYKIFMVELIKRKQDEIITKTAIRDRKLDQSMLSFTRIYRDENGELCKDLDSQEYSCIMTEYYGGVNVEHVVPRCGPMNGNEMLFITFKGRIVKDDLDIIIYDPTTKWSEVIKNFTINTGFIHFLMPPFPHRQTSRATVTIDIYCKKDRIYQTTYLYMSLLDQELADLRSGVDLSLTSNNADNLQCDILSNLCSQLPIAQKTSRAKPKKRLNSKQMDVM